jgi:hypothetical protein
MYQAIINQFVPVILEGLKAMDPTKEVSAAAIEYALRTFIERGGIYADSKRVGGVFRVINLEGETPQSRKIALEAEFSIPPFMDDRKYNIGDSVSIHDQLDNPNDQLRPTVVQVIHYLYSSLPMDLVIVKSFINNKDGFNDYIAKCKAIGLKTPAEMEAIFNASEQQASQPATPDTTSASVEPVALGPQLVES